MPFLPTTPQEIPTRPDFILVTGDAYVDHPSFGAAIIARLLQSKGYSVAVIAQPNWKTTADFTTFGEPRLAFLVTGGNIDSMVNHYSVSLHKRKSDAYSPGGQLGKRPNRATIVYCNKIREVYKHVPIIIGGLEASLRRLAHYDYWDNAVRRSILLDSSADIIVYGMGESQITQIAEALDSGLTIEDLTYIPGTVFKTRQVDHLPDALHLPPYQTIKEPTPTGKKEYAASFMIQYQNTDYLTAHTLVESYGNVYVVQNRPATPLNTTQLDRVYALPYERDYHPMYQSQGGVPAIEEVKFSIISNRGCFGGCHFCALTFHQGRVLQTRSHKSILNEAANFTHDPDFKGYIHDVGGPTANFRAPSCRRWFATAPHKGFLDQAQHDTRHVKPCKRQCLTPTPCKNLQYDHTDYLTLLRSLRQLPKVKKVFVRSGIRYDYLLGDKNGDIFLQELCQHHISGRLKVAPEHVSDPVLKIMGKSPFADYEKFKTRYERINQNLGKDQYLVPYLMSSHPGCSIKEAIHMAEYLQKTNHRPEQVQDFYPTPGTLSTCMYYTGLDPRTMEKIFVPKTPKEKAMQRALIQYRSPQNYQLVKAALVKAGRKDLIGHDPKALIRPLKGEGRGKEEKTGGRTLTKNIGKPAKPTGKPARPSKKKKPLQKSRKK